MTRKTPPTARPSSNKRLPPGPAGSGVKKDALPASAQFRAVVTALKSIGFEEGPRTKSHLFTLRRETRFSKGYVSIRWDYNNDYTTVLAEFWGRTATLKPGLGAEMHIVEVTPKRQNLTRFPGEGGVKATQLFAQIGAFMVKAAKINDAMEHF